MSMARRRLSIAAGAVAVALLLLYALRGLYVAPFLERKLVEAFDSALGMRVSVGAVGGSYFGSFEVRDLRTVEPAREGAIRSVDCGRLRAEYSLLSLLSGVEGFIARSTLRLEGGRVSLGASSPAEKTGGEERSGSLPLPRSLPTISIRDTDVSYEANGFGVTAEGISLEVSGGPGAPSDAALRIDHLDVRHPSLRRQPVSVAAGLTYEKGAVVIEGLEVNGRPVVRGGRADLAGLPDAASFEAEAALFDGEVKVSGGVKGPEVEVDLLAKDLVLERIDGMLAEGVGATGPLSAEVSLRLDRKRPGEVGGRVDLSWQEGSFRGIPVDSLRLQGGAGGGTLTVESAQGRVGDNSLAARGLSVPLTPLLEGDLPSVTESWSGILTLQMRDIPALFSLGGGPEIFREDAPAHHLHLEGELGTRSMTLAGGELTVGEGFIRLPRGVVTIPAEGGWRSTAVTLDLDVDLPDLALIGRVFPILPLEGTLGGTVRIEGSPASLKGRAEARSRGLVIGAFAVGDVDLVARADPGTVTVEQGTLRQTSASGENELRLRNLAGPSPALFGGRWIELLRFLKGDLSLAVHDARAFLGLFGVKLPGQEGEMPAHELFLSAAAAGGRLVFTEGRLDAAGGRLSLKDGFYSLPPEGEDWRGSDLGFDLKAELPDLSVLARLFPLPPVEGSLTGTVSVRGPISALAGEVGMEGQGLAVEGIPLGRFALDAGAEAGLLQVRSLEMGREQDFLKGQGAYEIGERRLRDVVLEVSVRDISLYAGGRAPDEWLPGGSLQGRIEASGELPWPAAAFDLELEDGRVGDIELSRASIRGGIEEKTLQVDEIQVESDQGTLSLGGRLVEGEGGELAVVVEHLDAARQGIQVALAEPSSITVEEWKRYRFEQLRLTGTMGEISVDGLLSIPGDSDVVVTFRGLTGDGWLEEVVGDRLAFREADLEVIVKGPLAGPDLAVSGRVGELRGRESPVPLAVELELGYDAAGITISTLRATAGNGDHISASGYLPYDPLAEEPLLRGEAALSAEIGIPDLKEFAFLLPEGYAVEGRAEGRVSLSGTWDELSGDADLEVRELFFPRDLRPAPPGPITIDCDFEVRPGTVSLRTLHVESPSLSAAASGSWTGAPDPLGVARGGEAPLQGTISVEGNLEAPDISWVANGIRSLRSAAGGIKGTFAVNGEITSPEVDAEADLREVAVRIAGAPGTSDVTGHLSLQGGTLRITALKGDLGGAPFELSGALAGIGRDELDFDLKAKGTGLLLYRDEGVRVRADADLTARGPLSKLAVAGSMMLTESRYSRNIDLLGSVGGQKAPTVKKEGVLFSFRDPPLRDLVFDLRLGTKDPFIVRNQFFRGSVSPDLRLVGTGEEPLLTGKVSLDWFRAQLPTGILRGEQGVVAFLKGDPNRPLIDVRGETRMMGYDITMHLTGFADDPKIIFSSSPPLPSDELLLLVLAGTPPKSADHQVASSSGTALSLFLARGFLGKYFGGGEETDDMILDRLETEVGREITENGDPTIDSTLRLREGIFWDGDTLYLTSQKDRYDDFNYGIRFTLEFRGKTEAEELRDMPGEGEP